MSSSQRFESSPGVASPGRGPRRKSKFTHRHLAQLASYSASSPLRVIAHIDLDAFYAQCEMIRLGVPEDRPLAVQQWQGLIAINYPARKYGISRHATIFDAKKMCPELITQHVATWKEGDETWAYRDDAFEHIATHKVSLDPYRMQSRKILAVIKESLPATPMQRVEKASVDEVFLDLSAHVHSMLLQRYPELSGPAPYDDPSESLPSPPTTVLDWKTDALIDLDKSETEDDDPDWDDIAMLIGSEVVRSVRSTIRERLQFTCSAGVAHNKMLSKLGSAYKKPNSQTIVRNRAVQQFLSDMKFTKIRNLGGKLGDQVVATFGSDTVHELLNVSLDQLKLKLGDDTGSWVHHIIRGVDFSEVNPRTQIKSMLSAKSFRPSINHFEQGVRWLRIFVADIFSRLVEEGVLENKRRPKTLNLHHRQGGHSRSRQAPIPQGRQIDEALLFDIARNLLSQFVVEGRVWPCANLSLSVGGFEEGPTGTQGIGAFLVKGEEARSMLPAARDATLEPVPPEKKRKVDSPNIQAFFSRQDSSASDPGVEADNESDREISHAPGPRETPKALSNQEDPHLQDVAGDNWQSHAENSRSTPTDHDRGHSQPDKQHHQLRQGDIASYLCEACSRSIPVAEKEEHDDWHYARSIQAEERANRGGTGADRLGPASDTLKPRIAAAARSGSNQAVKKRGRVPTSHRPAGAEKNQSKLAFGS